MFTDGLDESALNWVKQKSDVDRARTRSPLSETLDRDYPAPKSPFLYKTTSHVLPPLKFHSGVLGTHDTASHSLDSNDENDYDDEDEDDDDDESVGSVSQVLDCSYSEIEGFDDEIFDRKSNSVLNPVRVNRENGGIGNVSTLNRGVLKDNLRVEVPQSVRRFTDTDFGYGGGSGLRSSVSARSAYATPMADLGTPSAPPIMEFGERGSGNSQVGSELGKDSGGQKHVEQIANVNLTREQVVHEFYTSEEPIHDWKAQSQTSELPDRENNVVVERSEAPMPYWQMNSLEESPQYSTSSQNAWQTLIAYDACIRLCLNAWARGCTEAPDFLSDECRLLRSAFGLHKFLLQPRGVKPMPSESKGTEQAGSLKIKKAVGKIRVEVKKIRIIPRRKLKSTYSQRSSMYLQAGAEYVRQVSSAVKTGINSLGLVSLALTSEEPMSCLLQLRSSTEDTDTGPSSVISIRPGYGDYHDFFPESQGDALLLEVQDSKKVTQGRAIIPFSSLTDNPNDRLRWWPIYHEDQECVGKAQLSISSTVTCSETTNNLKSAAPVVETLAYDLLLDAAMRAQHFHARNLWISQPWKWLLIEFADYYGVSESYTKLRYLSHVMSVATPTKDCLELIHELLVPVLKARSERRLTRQEKSLLLDCETQVESLLALAFESYKSLDESCDTGLADKVDQIPEAAAPALAPAVQLYTLLHDILAQDAQTMLKNYIQTAARKTCRKHMVETDEFLSSNSDGFLMDHIAISTSYLKMKNLCTNLSDEIKADIKIHDQHILPSCIDLSSITAAVYSTQLCERLKGFLAAWPPSSPQTHVNELLIATADFERNLESWNISPVQGGVDSRNLYHDYIMVWVQDMQLTLLDLCKAEKVPWAGVITNYSTSPFAEEMYDKIKEMLNEYEVVINRWPQYTLILENAVANVERALIKALEKQYGDILTPLKDSIPKRLGIQVQKLTRRQSTTLYHIPNQLGTFLNTIKRILEVLHCRVEEKLKSWASYLPANGDKKSTYGEQMNGITVLLRTKYKNYMQATVVKLVSNMQASRSTRLQRILEETKEADGESEVRERMQLLCSQLVESVSNLHEVFTSQIFIASCRGFWDRMGQIVLKFLEGRKENRVWYSGSYHALGILDDTFASQMQRLQGNALQDKDIEPPRSIVAARSILCRDTTNVTDTSTYLYF